jgi:hypothetical protein
MPGNDFVSHTYVFLFVLLPTQTKLPPPPQRKEKKETIEKSLNSYA